MVARPDQEPAMIWPRLAGTPSARLPAIRFARSMKWDAASSGQTSFAVSVKIASQHANSLAPTAMGR
jgi:hypothetical protein